MDNFIKLSDKFKYGLCQLTKMASKMATTHQFALVDTNKLSHLSPDFSKIVSEYDQEIPQLQTADNPVALRQRAAQPSRDTRKTN